MKFRLYTLLWLMLLMTGCQPGDQGWRLNLSSIHKAADTREDLVTALVNDSEINQYLELFPLVPGSRWTYRYQGYDGSEKVLWQVVETVAEGKMEDGGYLAKIDRKVELMAGEPVDGFKSKPGTGTYWYWLKGGNLYRFAAYPDPNFSNTWLELVFPLNNQTQPWYPDLGQTAHTDPDTLTVSQLSEPYPQKLPFNGIFTCYHLETQFENSSTDSVVCEGLGFTSRSYHYQGRQYGHWYELIDVSFP